MQQMVTLPRMPAPGAHQIQRPVRPPPTRMRSSATPFKALSDGRVKDAFGAWSTCMKAKGFTYASPVAAVDDTRGNVLMSSLLRQ
ncbi:hypothetical protein [Streptomyces mirabilis]|uniref:hypothetical protein n=3 Tax=Streptomyces mirabilis TaxID=68239 RepID=UPI003323A0D8